MKHCPECQTELDLKKYTLFHTWVCPEGHGTLYPAGELERIVQAISGLGNLELKIWSDHELFSVTQSALISPDGHTPLLEIRDKNHMNIIVYGDPETHALWLHTGEEEKLMAHLDHAVNADPISAYLALVAEQAVGIFDDEKPLSEATGKTLIALKLLGERILSAMPNLF